MFNFSHLSLIPDKMNQVPLTDTMKEESLYVNATPDDRLHVKRWYRKKGGVPILLVHGSIENGRIFYSDKGKGLAPWLAAKGYDVFVPDLRGRGKSTPRITRNSDFGVMESINNDIPLLVDLVKDTSGRQDLFVGAHSWGGNLLLCWCARYPEQANVLGVVLFGTRRRVTIWNWERFLKLTLAWGMFGRYLLRKQGFLDAVRYKMGGDNETARTHAETDLWLYSKNIEDPTDGYDYREAMEKREMPPILSLTGGGDRILGNPQDCKLLLTETGALDVDFRVIGKTTGHLHNYDHITLLTHRQASEDLYPIVENWLRTKTEAR